MIKYQDKQQRSVKWLVSSDLDGTLLDHYTYSWLPAKPSIDALIERDALIVLNTSKTYSEVAKIEGAIGINAPFIVENGSAIYFPNSFSIADAEAYNDTHQRIVLGALKNGIVSFLHMLRKETQWQFSGYSDWSTEDIIEHTGLSLEQAEQSQARQFSEPLIWSDNDANYQSFCQRVESAGFRILHGGRFIHVLGTSDKGRAILNLKAALGKADKARSEDDYVLVCLGDSYNDLDMLKVADHPILVRSPAHPFPPYADDGNKLYRTKNYGPEGWKEAMSLLLFSYKK